MTTPPRTKPLPRWPVWLLWVVASLLGLKFGYDFGYQLGGMLFGALTALYTALFCSILADAAADRLLRLLAPKRDDH